jgi:hypothetical protein
MSRCRPRRHSHNMASGTKKLPNQYNYVEIWSSVFKLEKGFFDNKQFGSMLSVWLQIKEHRPKKYKLFLNTYADTKLK